jgi:hypothetical protein
MEHTTTYAIFRPGAEHQGEPEEVVAGHAGEGHQRQVPFEVTEAIMGLQGKIISVDRHEVFLTRLAAYRWCINYYTERSHQSMRQVEHFEQLSRMRTDHAVS